MSAEHNSTELYRELIRTANLSTDVQQLFDDSLDLVLSGLGAEVGGACLLDGEAPRIIAQRGLDAGLPESQEPTICERWLSCAEWEEPLASLELLSGDPLASNLRDLGYDKVLVTPLKAHRETLGFLFVATRDEDALTKSERVLLDVAGQILGLTADNARLSSAIERQQRESQTVYEVSRAFVSTPKLDSLLNLIVRSAVETIDKALNCVLHLLDEDTDELRPRALSFIGKARPDVVGRSRMRLGLGAAGHALETGQTLNIPDVASDPGFVRVGDVRPFASMLVAPLKLGEHRIGTLSVDSNETGAFSDDDARLLSTLAAQAAAAIENARLVHDLQRSVDDLKAAQARLVQSEKLSAIGQLIAGVAHELNNPLTAVMGYAQLLQTDVNVNQSILRDLNKIYLQAQRAARIVQNLLTFARQQKAQREFVNVNDLLRRTLELRTYQLRVENITVETQLDENVLGTLADASQLQTVFLNLINNAQDAITDAHGGGHLIVRSEVDDGHVLVRIIDDGPGITADVHQHLFEPFFTTKEVGRGTGLGLSICFGIVAQHDGNIWAESELGHGTTFVVELPHVQKPPASEESEGDVPVLRSRGKRVLIVEDEIDVAGVFSRILTQKGHHVVLAQNGDEALARLAEFRARDIAFDMIISDIKMPGLSGPALYERIESEDPDLIQRMMFITGDTMGQDTQAFLERVSRPYLAKPFTVTEFGRMTAEILG